MHGGGVEVVLVGGRLLRLRLDEELAGEADLLLVIDGQVEELGQVVELALQVGVVEVHVAFPAAPEDVVDAAQLLGDFEGLLDLGRGVGEDVGIATAWPLRGRSACC